MPRCTCWNRFSWRRRRNHLLGAGVLPEHLNDNRLGRVLDGLYLAG
ncbi:DUF4277 domain-containing protein [Oculatella sp. LEGE 06141]|nr:DUF4277 domain-containing protein [Oculatella sp. LEGE 06141]